MLCSGVPKEGDMDGAEMGETFLQIKQVDEMQKFIHTGKDKGRWRTM